MWRAHALVAGLKFRLLGQFFQFLDEHRALGQPEWQPGTDIVVKREKLHLAANLAVVTLARLLLSLEPLVELCLILKRRAVDALQLRVLFVTAIVGGGDSQQLECLNVAGAHDMRAGAQIDELAVLVKRNLLALGDVVDALDLEILPALGVVGLGLLACFCAALECLVFLRYLFHLGLDGLEVLG